MSSECNDPLRNFRRENKKSVDSQRMTIHAILYKVTYIPYLSPYIFARNSLI